MHHTYVEVEEGVSLVDPNLLVPPKGGDILLYKTPIFLFTQQRWKMFSYICGPNPPLSPKGGYFVAYFEVGVLLVNSLVPKERCK